MEFNAKHAQIRSNNNQYNWIFLDLMVQYRAEKRSFRYLERQSYQ
jgi:hypothetical protein